ncbi:MAG: twin-arginine translocase TatA/TatE family subunit [Sphingobacteriales bacterium]|nr:twin-arginine translocase TatA/TatE family subunit [Sphingobacteriales bacterium]MBI3718352.1 twin-arginine translocase TatA/TatE family subunit [Sphingobacteriales bacterium]
MFSSDSLLLIGAPTGWEWIIIVVAVLVLFGGKKIPEFMRGIGKGIREFNDAKENVKKEIETGMTEKDKDEEIKRLKQQLEEKNAAQ